MRRSPMRRYRVRLESRESLDRIVIEALKQNKRILWVVNQVAKAQKIAKQFGAIQKRDMRSTSGGVPVLCYHSRFTLDDRKNRHREVVDAFRLEDDEPPHAVLAVTTQVCEMSLDLDADLLITELCPVTLLVQRMGRCNRKPYAPVTVGEVSAYEPKNDWGREDERPYEKDDMYAALAFVNDLAKLEGASQTKLEATLQAYGRKPASGDRHVPFISCDPYADSRNDPFRDIDERSDPGILNEAAYVATDRETAPGSDCARSTKVPGPALRIKMPATWYWHPWNTTTLRWACATARSGEP